MNKLNKFSKFVNENINYVNKYGLCVTDITDNEVIGFIVDPNVDLIHKLHEITWHFSDDVEIDFSGIDIKSCPSIIDGYDDHNDKKVSLLITKVPMY
jgi:hypothetical protein